MTAGAGGGGGGGGERGRGREGLLDGNTVLVQYGLISKRVLMAVAIKWH